MFAGLKQKLGESLAHTAARSPHIANQPKAVSDFFDIPLRLMSVIMPYCTDYRLLATVHFHSQLKKLFVNISMRSVGITHLELLAI